MRAALKPFAFLAALIPVLAPKVAEAETTIADARTTPITTTGIGDDIKIISTGSVKPSPATGAAVTVDSSKNVTNQGVIEFNNSTGTATGILIDTAGGLRTSNVTNSNAINLIEDYTATDSDSDGDFDGLYAQGSDRFGIRLTGANGLDGDIVVDSAGTISIEGRNSAGIQIDGPLIGDLKDAGSITILGDNSYGIRTTGNITGGINFTGSITSKGGGTSGISIEGDVSGLVHLQGRVNNNGFRFDSRPTDDVIAKLDADDALLGGSAVAITGNLAGGLLFDAPPPDNDANNADEDSDGTPDANEIESSITQTGSEPAVKIGDSGGSAITLGNVGSGTSAFGAINKGSITSVGILTVLPGTSTTIPTTGVRIENANLNGGFSNSGSIISGSFDANSTGVSVGAASTLGAINNSGTITSNLVTDLASPVVSAIGIDSGANVASIVNSGSLSVNVSGEAADGAVIFAANNSLTSITNSGSIAVNRIPTDDANDTDDSDLDPSNEVITGNDIAIDLSGQTNAGTTITQVAPASTTAAAPTIVGDILFGSGADTLDVQKGTITGDISFGAGADQLLISGGAGVTGILSDSDGNLGVTVSDGDLTLRNTSNVTISSLNVGATGNLFLSIDPQGGTAGHITVNGASGATFAGGSQLSVLLKSAISGGPGVPTVFNLVTTTGGGTIAGAPLATLQDAPFIYNAQIAKNLANTSLDLTLTRKAATGVGGLGLNSNEAAFYEPFFQTALGDAALMETFLGLGTQQTFDDGFAQFLPNVTGAQVDFAASREQALTNMLFSRYMGTVKPNREIYAWAHEITYSRDREQTVQGQGYDGFGFGFAFGLDGPMGKTGYKGFGISLTSDEINEKAGSDNPFTVTSVEASGHVVQPIGGVVLGARLGAAYDVFRSKRQIVIDPDLDAPSLSRGPKADWAGAHVSAALHAAYPTKLGVFSVRPDVGVDAVAMWEQDYEEKNGGTGLNLAIDSRQTTRANASATLAIGLPFYRNGFAFTPEFTVGARAPLLKDPYEVNGHFVSAPSNTFALASESFDSPSAIAGLALNVEGRIGSLRLEGEAEQADGETTATGRVVLRLTF